MKQIQITFLLISIGLFASLSTFAQDNSEKGISIQKHLNELDEVYSLTKSQKVQVEKFVIEYVEQQEQLKSLEVSSFSELKNAYSDISKKLHESVKSVLTTKQINKESAWFYYPHFQVKSYKKVCVKEKSDEMATVETEMYRREKMLPKLIVQRKKLDDIIKAKDRERMTELRKELIDAKKAVDDFQKMNQYDFISAVGLSDKQSKIYSNLISEMHEKSNEINSLLSKYSTDIESVLNEIEPLIKQWNTDLKAIEYKYFPKREERQNKWTDEEKAKVEENKISKFKFDFLLLDKSSDYSYKNKMDIETTYLGNSHTINLELKKEGKITLELQDKDGKLLQTVLSEHRTAGLHILNIDVLDAENSLYKYILKTSDQETISAPISIHRRL